MSCRRAVATLPLALPKLYARLGLETAPLFCVESVISPSGGQVTVE